MVVSGCAVSSTELGCCTGCQFLFMSIPGVLLVLDGLSPLEDRHRNLSSVGNAKKSLVMFVLGISTGWPGRGLGVVLAARWGWFVPSPCAGCGPELSESPGHPLSKEPAWLTNWLLPYWNEKQINNCLRVTVYCNISNKSMVNYIYKEAGRRHVSLAVYTHKLPSCWANGNLWEVINLGLQDNLD